MISDSLGRGPLFVKRVLGRHPYTNIRHAIGRSQPYIREELMLSKNTVSSHVQHIYVKLGVHSKQELIDAVEAQMGR